MSWGGVALFFGEVNFLITIDQERRTEDQNFCGVPGLKRPLVPERWPHAFAAQNIELPKHAQKSLYGGSTCRSLSPEHKDI